MVWLRQSIYRFCCRVILKHNRSFLPIVLLRYQVYSRRVWINGNVTYQRLHLRVIVHCWYLKSINFFHHIHTEPVFNCLSNADIMTMEITNAFILLSIWPKDATKCSHHPSLFAASRPSVTTVKLTTLGNVFRKQMSNFTGSVVVANSF